MNFLAHCYLSCSDEDVLIGNFITDFISKKEAETYTGGIKKGIDLHRNIDEYTDHHEASLALRKILRRRHGKYAPVVVDLVWDYFLSINWRHYSGSTLVDFNKGIYEILLRRIDELPDKLSGRISEMIKDDFLMAYATEDRMKESLAWMDNRVKFASAFHETPYDIKENYKEIETLFGQFFPDLIAYSEEVCPC